MLPRTEKVFKLGGNCFGSVYVLAGFSVLPA